MTVKITKPELNLREKISELDKPSGIAGEAMLRAETPRRTEPDWSWCRNKSESNGDLRVSQRGTYTSATNKLKCYFLDRWLVDRQCHSYSEHTTGTNSASCICVKL